MNTRLSDIEVKVEGGNLDTGNALPVLHEILHALRRLADSGETAVIDLRAIPFGPGDQDRLLNTLGEGEVRVTVDALGLTHVWETRFPGVWVIDYRDTDDQSTGLQVEISDLPSLIRTPTEDIQDAVQALESALVDSESL